MDIFPDGLTGEQYKLLRNIQNGNVRHFNAGDAGVLVNKGFAVITDPGDLSVTDEGMKVLRILKVRK